MRRAFLRTAGLAIAAAATSGTGVLAWVQRAGTAAALPAVLVNKDPSCGCCSAWGTHMERAGFRVSYVNTSGMDAVRTKYKVPRTLQSCHTAIVDGYVVEGHVPAADVKRLLAQRPKVVGLAVPGMPIGSPGMEQGATRQSYAVMSFDAAGKAAIFAEH